MKTRIKKRTYKMKSKDMTRIEFRQYLRKDKMLDMMDLVFESLREELTEMKMYEYFKEELEKGKKHGSFIMLQNTIDNLTSEIELDEGGEEVGNIIMKNFYSYWLSDLLMKQRNMSYNALTYATICKDELGQYMDFYELAKLIQNVDEDRESLLRFLSENWNEDIEDDIDTIRDIVDHKNLYADTIHSIIGDINYIVNYLEA